MEGKDRIIVALDVPTHDRAVALVEKIDNVSIFKVGLQLFLAGNLYGLLTRIQERRNGHGGVFIDLKTPGDIDNTIVNAFVHRAHEFGIRFVTFTEAAEPSFTEGALAAGRAARRDPKTPEFLMVSLLSSVAAPSGSAHDADSYIVERGRAMLDTGCDGLVVSGTAIGACRDAFPAATLVSPGIRPAWSSRDEHVRFATPAEAIRLGADYLVVGRPVLNAAHPREAAQRIIDEIDDAARPTKL